MENLLKLLASRLFANWPRRARLSQHQIADLSASSLFFIPSPGFDISISENGDRVYFHQHSEGDVDFGLLCVEHTDEILEDAEGVCRTYLQKLKGPFFIFHETSLTEEVNWHQPEVRCFESYWQDGGKADWRVRSFVYSRMVAILYVKNISAGEVMVQDSFLNGFRAGRG